MRPRFLLLIVFAVLIATVTAVLFNRVITRSNQPAQTASLPAGPVEGIEIAVAAREIKMGDVVKDGDVVFATWPAPSVDQRYLRRDRDQLAAQSLSGTIARHALYAGEPLTADAFYRREKAGVMAGLLDPGMVALSVPVSAVTGAAGFVLPNDHVDVLLTQDVRSVMQVTGSLPLTGDLMRYAAEPVLTDIRVLSVDEKFSAPDNASNLPGKTVTLELSPKDADILVVSAKMGELVLALRSVTNDPAEPNRKGYLGDMVASTALGAANHQGSGHNGPTGTVLINRGGVISAQNVAY